MTVSGSLNSHFLDDRSWGEVCILGTSPSSDFCSADLFSHSVAGPPISSEEQKFCILVEPSLPVLLPGAVLSVNVPRGLTRSPRHFWVGAYGPALAL